MSTTAFGPQGPNYTTVRPPGDPKASAGVDTFAKNCSQAGAKDGTNLTADFYNTIIANLRYLCRYAPIELDDADDTMVYRAVQKMVASVTATQLTSNITLWVNPALGNDTNDGLANTAPRALKTMQRAIDLAFSFLAGQFVVTIRLADGLYTNGFITPLRPGPAVDIVGNLANPAAVQVNASAVGATMAVWGPNVVSIRGVKGTSLVTNDRCNIFVANNGSTLTLGNIDCGTCGGGSIVAAAASIYIDGPCKFSGNAGRLLNAGYTGAVSIMKTASMSISGAITVSFAVAAAGLGGIIFVDTPTPVFDLSSGSVSGLRYTANANGIINTNGAGANYFPGTSTGTTSNGGIYA